MRVVLTLYVAVLGPSVCLLVVRVSKPTVCLRKLYDYMYLLSRCGSFARGVAEEAEQTRQTGQVEPRFYCYY